jgi:DNA-binding IclR family transcriptional regulator
MSDKVPEGKSERRVEAVNTTCRLLELLRDRTSAGITQLAEEMDISKSTVHAHLATLRDNELVRKEGENYQLSLNFLRYGHHVREFIKSYDVIATETTRLAEDTGEVAQFMVEEHDCGVYIFKHTGENGVRTASYVGSREHLHCTALGKAILSQYQEERIERVIERRGLPRKTENTITEPTALFEELDAIRDRGIAYDHGEILEGLRCIAKPVQGPGDQILGAISISGPVSRFKSDARKEDLEETLSHSANVIEINAARVM